MPPGPEELAAAQCSALHHVTATARQRRAEALARIGAGVDADRLLARVPHGRVSLNFHPDRLLADGCSVADGLATDGRYRSQFETGISNGSRTAFAGGDRDGWEHRLFGDAYRAATAAQRPTYGSLNLVNHPDGGSPRFGSCHVRLRPEVSRRCTFTVGDSHAGPTDAGTLAALECVLAGLLERARATGVTLGAAGLDPEAMLMTLPESPAAASRIRPPGRSLDDYLEAQVHGPVDLARDAEALVLDPSFAGTPTGRKLVRLAGDSGIPVNWHAGFELHPDEFGPDFRGAHVPPFARAVAAGHAGPRGLVNAAVVGQAAAAAIRDPAGWQSWGTAEDVLQALKHLWHTLVQFGHPAGGGAD